MDRAVLDLAADVREGLSANPRRLPPRLFYDAEGSALFEEITRLPEYYLTRTEEALLERHAGEMIAAASQGERLTAVELGAGSARKTVHLLRALVQAQGGGVFVPVDVSPAALELARASVTAAVPGLSVEPLEGRYRIALEALRHRPGRKLVLFIGSSIGNFDPDEALELLRDFRAGLSEGDSLLLGTDLAKDPAILQRAYDDDAGVTARFNKNVLARINRELGGNFDLDAFRHVALWNLERSRIEMHLESTREQDVTIAALDLTVHFAQGERLHTENSYKFDPARVDALLTAAGFSPRQRWTDPPGWFALTLASPGVTTDDR